MYLHTIYTDSYNTSMEVLEDYLNTIYNRVVRSVISHIELRRLEISIVFLKNL